MAMLPMKILNTLLAFGASAFFMTSCQKELGFTSSHPPSNSDTTVIITPPRDTLPHHDTTIVVAPASDTANIIIRDGDADASFTAPSSNFFIEPIQGETGVPQSNWFAATYSSTGTHTIKISAPSSVTPLMETFGAGLWDTRYKNPTHTVAAGYSNSVLPVNVEVKRNDGGIVAYSTKVNSTGSIDTLQRAKVAYLKCAEEVIVRDPNRITATGSVSHTANVRANSALGQPNGVTWHFTP